ncbi:MAG: hypothetical protein HY547_02875 [Elusimicrobia bacterium]|nr:hypothetical protein [Elusimicrobiota bacterium]
MADFNDIFNELKKGVADIAKREAKEYVKQAQEDGQAFLDNLKIDLELWARQLAEGKMSKADFEFLVKGKKNLAEMKALTQTGIAAARVDRVRTAFVNLAIGSVDKLI